MQPDNLLETDFTRAARETIALANQRIEARLAGLDQSTFKGQYIAAASRFQLQVQAASLLWQAGEDERGTSFPVLMNALGNGIANILASVLASKLDASAHQRAAEQLMHEIHRDLLHMIKVAEATPDHADRIVGREVSPTGRA
jgi:hypothetical protein